MPDQIESRETSGAWISSVDPILQSTIFNQDKENRRSDFIRAWERWEELWKREPRKQGYFQTEEEKSPFSQYSSKGWKIHIAFEKGRERAVAKSLYLDGLYFKVESQMGTYFNGLRESGSTVYIGSYDNMIQISGEIERTLGQYLTDGPVAYLGQQPIRMGSGSDIEIKPKIMARFDVAKTPFGWLEGNRKYAEHGLPTWMGLAGIPILKTCEPEVSRIENNWPKMLLGQRKIYLERVIKPAYEESRAELIKDFGAEFVFGTGS